MTTVFHNGIPVTYLNKITQDEPTFYVSYNPSTRDYGTDTTALRIKETGQFLILSGNHTSQYEGLQFQEALAYFYSHINLAVPQSEHGKVFKFENDKAMYVEGGY